MTMKEDRKLPEKTAYTRYYEYDGHLRAYANRSMVYAFMFGILAFLMAGFAIYVRMQPPLIIQLSESGGAQVVSPNQAKQSLDLRKLTVSTESVGVAPSEVEINNVLKTFLTQYLSHNPSNIERNLADALNLMTSNLRRATLNQLRHSGIVEKVKENNLTSDIKITSVLPSKEVQYAYTVFVAKEVRQIKKGVETTDRIVGAHYLRLILGGRSVDNPHGLFVAEYWEKPMFGEKNRDLLQKAEISGSS